MKSIDIEFIYKRKGLFRIVWVLFGIVYAYFMVLGFKYIPYTFLVENSSSLIAFWLLLLAMTNIFVYLGVYILFIEEIYEWRFKNGRKRK